MSSSFKLHKTTVFCLLVLLSFSCLAIFDATSIYAQDERATTEVNYPAIPGVTAPQEIGKDGDSEQSFPLFMGYMFRFILAVSIIVAVVIIFYGGALYMLSANNPERKKHAIGWIRGAIQGMLIMLFSHFILTSIDSRFLIFTTKNLEKVQPSENITLTDEIKDTYFQIPLGLLIEDLGINEVARDRLHDVLDATYDAEDSAEAVVTGTTDMIDIIKYCNEGSSCSGNKTFNIDTWPSVNFRALMSYKPLRHPMGCWWEENVTRSERTEEVKKPEMGLLDRTAFDNELINLENQKTILNLDRIEIEEINRNKLFGFSEEGKQRIREIVEKMRNIINYQDRTDIFTAEARRITEDIYSLLEDFPEVKNTVIYSELGRIINFSNVRSTLPKWDKGHNNTPYIMQSDIRWRHFKYGWTTLERKGSLIASATMALQHLKVELTILDALNFATQNNYQISPLEGTMFGFLEHIVRDYGFNYDGTTNPNINDIDKIIEWLEGGKGPVVIEGVALPWDTDPNTKHSIVLTGVDRQHNVFYINDPKNPFRNTIRVQDAKLNLPRGIGYAYNGEAFKCGTPIMHEGQSYRTVKIGNQCFTAENMNFDNGCYRNQLVPDRYDGCGYYIDESGKEVKEFGLLYQWDAANEACPEGWRLTTDTDFRILERELGMEDLTTSLVWRGVWRGFGDVGRKLKARSGWIRSGNGTNDYGFNALPGGFWRPRELPEPDELGYPINYGFNGLREEGTWWASSLIPGGSHANMRALHSSQAGIKRSADRKDYAFSVRCTLDIPTGRIYDFPEDFFNRESYDIPPVEEGSHCPHITTELRKKINTMKKYNEKLYIDLNVLHQSKEIIEENMYQLYRVLTLKSLGVNYIFDYSQLLSQKLEYKVSSKINTQSDVDFGVLHRFDGNPSNPHSWNWQKWENNALYRTDELIEEGEEKTCVTATVENDPVNFYLKTPDTNTIIFDALIKLAHRKKQEGLQHVGEDYLTSKKEEVNTEKYAEEKFYDPVINFFINLISILSNKETYASNLPATIEECIEHLNINIENITQDDIDRIYNECDPSLTRMPGESPEDYLTCKMEIPIGEAVDILWKNFSDILFAVDGYIEEALKLIDAQKEFTEIIEGCSCACLGGNCTLSCNLESIEEYYNENIIENRKKARRIAQYIHYLTNGFYWRPTVNVCDRLNADIASDDEKEMCKTVDFYITKHELVARKLGYSRSKFNQCIVRPEKMDDVFEWGKIGTRTYFGPVVEKHDIPRVTKTIIGNIVQNTHDFNWFCCTDYEDY